MAPSVTVFFFAYLLRHYIDTDSLRGSVTVIGRRFVSYVDFFVMSLHTNFGRKMVNAGKFVGKLVLEEIAKKVKH